MYEDNHILLFWLTKYVAGTNSWCSEIHILKNEHPWAHRTLLNTARISICIKITLYVCIWKRDTLFLGNANVLTQKQYYEGLSIVFESTEGLICNKMHSIFVSYSEFKNSCVLLGRKKEMIKLIWNRFWKQKIVPKNSNRKCEQIARYHFKQRMRYTQIYPEQCPN